MHGTDLDNVSGLLALENAVSTPSRHTRNIEKLGAVDHVVVFSACHTHPSRLDLKAQAALVFPQGGGDSWLHACWGHLASRVEVGVLILLPASRPERQAVRESWVCQHAEYSPGVA